MRDSRSATKPCRCWGNSPDALRPILTLCRERRLGGGEAGDGHPEGRARHIIEAEPLAFAEPEAKQRPSSELKFGFKPRKPPPKVLTEICKSAAARRALSRCKGQ